MPAHVVLTLDTTAPSFAAALVEDTNTLLSTLTFTSHSDDAAEVKVWGDIDPTWPGNADYGETEGGAEWITFAESLELRLTGAKLIHVRVRDDVHNQSGVKTYSPSGEVTPPPVPPRQVSRTIPRRPSHEVVTSRSRIRVRSRSEVHLREPGMPTRSRIRVRTRPHIASVTHDSSRILVRTRDVRGVVLRGRSAVGVRTRGDLHRRELGPQTEAALIELDIL